MHIVCLPVLPEYLQFKAGLDRNGRGRDVIGRKPKQKVATIWQPGQSFILVQVSAELIQQENAHVNVVGVTLHG